MAKTSVRHAFSMSPRIPERQSIFVHLALCLVCLAALASHRVRADEGTAKTMKAVRLHSYGGAEVLKYEDAPRPDVKDDEILVRVIAASVNPVDAKVRQGHFKPPGAKMPLIVGYDISGVVEKSGPKATKFKPGDAVYAYLALDRGGAYAEYAIAKDSEAALKPASITHEQAAAVPLAALTAWQALVETAKLEPGQTVLIHGGSGGVGAFAIQIAKARGAKVIATASTANQEFLKQRGADQAIDYKTTKFEDVVKDVDVVLDLVAGDTLTRSYGVVKKGGIIVSVLDDPDPAELKKREIRGTAILVRPEATMLAELSKLIDAKKITPVVSQVVPLAETAKAHAAIETGHTRGKIVLRVADEPQR
jgi:NADPH:quinone reductase-like Zn-dependent oxidoreductase